MRDLTGFSTGSFGVHSRLLLGTSVLVGASLLNGDSNGVMLEDGLALGSKPGTLEAIVGDHPVLHSQPMVAHSLGTC